VGAIGVAICRALGHLVPRLLTVFFLLTLELHKPNSDFVRLLSKHICVLRQTEFSGGNVNLFMVVLCNRADHYILPCGFFLLSFFPRLISAVGDWMSAILRHMVWL